MRSDSFISNHRSDRNKAIILWLCFVASVASITATSFILQPKLLSSFFTTHSLLELFSSSLSKHPEGNLRYHHRLHHDDAPMTAAAMTTNDNSNNDIQTNKIRHRFENDTNSTNSNEAPRHDSLLLLQKNDTSTNDSVLFVSDLIRIRTKNNVSSNKRRRATSNSSSSDDGIKDSSSIDRNNSFVRSSSNDYEGDDEATNSWKFSVLYFVHMFCYVCIGIMLLYVCHRLSKCCQDGFSGVTLTTGRAAMSEYTGNHSRQHQQHNNIDADHGPISTEAGLAGMTYKERELILKDVFQLTTFQYDATKSLFVQIAYRKKQEPKKDTHLRQSTEMKKSNTFITNANTSIRTDDDVGDVADDDLSSMDIDDDESFVVDGDKAKNDDDNAPDKTSSNTDHIIENNYNVENGPIVNNKQDDDIDETAQLSAPSLSPSAACPLKGEQVVVPQETTSGDVNDDIDGCDTDCISSTHEQEVQFPNTFNKADDDDNVTIPSATTLSAARSADDNVIIECLGDGNHINDDDGMIDPTNDNCSCSSSSAIATCSICLETFKDGCTIITGTQCNHVFHEECCFEWYRKNDLCPYCRTEIMDQYEMRTAAVRTLGKDRVVELQRRNFRFSLIP